MLSHDALRLSSSCDGSCRLEISFIFEALRELKLILRQNGKRCFSILFLPVRPSRSIQGRQVDAGWKDKQVLRCLKVARTALEDGFQSCLLVDRLFATTDV